MVYWTLVVCVVILAQLVWTDYKLFREHERMRRFRFEVRAQLSIMNRNPVPPWMRDEEIKEWREELRERDDL